MRVALDLLELRCVRPVSGTRDLCYVMAAGSAGAEIRVVRVHPEEDAWANDGYAWPMESGTHRDLRVRMASAELGDFESMTLRVIAAARIGGSYASSLGLASELAQQAQSLGAMMPVVAIAVPLPEQFGNGDVLLGEFTLSVTNMGGEATDSLVYSPSAQPSRPREKGGTMALRLTANQADYEIVLAVRAPAPPPREMSRETLG